MLTLQFISFPHDLQSVFLHFFVFSQVDQMAAVFHGRLAISLIQRNKGCLHCDLLAESIFGPGSDPFKKSSGLFEPLVEPILAGKFDHGLLP